jgi:hypothetical protein
MSNIDRREVSAEGETVEAFLESFRRFQTIYNTMPPEVQSAFLIFLEWIASRDREQAFA